MRIGSLLSTVSLIILTSYVRVPAVPAAAEPVREFIVSVDRGGSWEEAGRLAYRTDFTDEQLVLPAGLTGPVRIMIRHAGTTLAHIDRVMLDGAAPVAVTGTLEDTALALRKLSGTDHDVIDASNRSVVLTFGAGAGGVLAMNGRIEPVEISPVPFQFPEKNSYTDIGTESDFYVYRLGRCPGHLTVDGELDGEELCEPFFKVFCKPGSGHPDAYTWGWVRDDGESLYVAVDFATDNTMDGDKDYVKVYVNRLTDVKCFKVSVPEQTWGKPGFTYTERAGYQHKVYEFALPLTEVMTHEPRPGAVVELAFGAYGTSAMRKVMFVHPDGNDANNGRNWGAAKRTLRGALAAALPDEEIWVAQGTYYPDGGTGDRNASFTFPADYIRVLGGFNGTEIYGDERDPVAHPCTLSGDIGVPGDVSDNSLHVISGGNSYGAGIDGFTVTGGNADGPAYPGNAGGAVLLDGTRYFNVYDCVFTGNRAVEGGAVHSRNSGISSIMMFNVFFKDNRAEAAGGAVFGYNSHIVINSSVITGNSARTGGGVFCAGTTAVNIDRSTLYANTAVNGGALAGQGNSPAVRSLIIWGNTASATGAAGYFTAGAPYVGFCCIEGGLPGGFAGDAPVDEYGNLDAYPAFVNTSDIAGSDLAFGTADDGLALRAGSPCENAGYEGGHMGAYQQVVDMTPAVLAVTAVNGSTAVLSWDAGIADATVDSVGVWFLEGRLPQYAFDGSTAVMAVMADSGGTVNGLVPGREYSFRLFWRDTELGWSGDTAMSPEAVVRMPYTPKVVYVDSSAAGSGDGTSWGTAFNRLYDALDAARETDTLWVAAGTYYPVPDSVPARDSVLWVKPGVVLLGGFAGTEFRAGQRDWTTNRTVLSGDIGVRGDNSDNSLTVVMCGNGAVVDGCTVQDGNNESGGMIDQMDQMLRMSPLRSSGGGLGTQDIDSLRIANCVFNGNFAQWSGGALYLSRVAHAVIEDCRFIGNAAGSGGAVYCSDCSPVIRRCVFSGNMGMGDGSAVYCDYQSSPVLEGCIISGENGQSAVSSYYRSSPVVTGCIIAGTAGNGYNAAEYCFPTLENCVVAGNAGSGLYLAQSAITFTGGTVFGNDGSMGGGLNLDESYDVQSRFTNSVFWGNRASESGGELYIALGEPAFHHCIVEDGLYGAKVDFADGRIEDVGRNGSADPQFVNGVAGTWNGAPVYDRATGVSAAVLTGAGWNAGEHTGRFLCPDISGTMRLFYVTGNTADTLFVLGDVSDIAFSDVDFTMYDTRLQDGSPAVNAGYGKVVNTAVDAAGAVRIQRGAVDMGAYESAWYADRTPPDVSGLVLSAAAKDTGAVVLSWNPDAVPDADLDSFAVWYRAGFPVLDPDTALAVKAGTYPATASVDTVYGLLPRTEYFFSLFALDITGNWSDTVRTAMALSATPPPYDTLYVDAAAAGNGDGSSWTDAFTDLQAALAVADSFTDIWVAHGRYYPGVTIDRNATFALKPFVSLYGGFAGGETARGQRDWRVNRTVLSGDIGIPGDSSDNTYHVVTGADSAVLDGFTVRDGMADFTSGDTQYGGGIFCVDASPAIRNCTVVRNGAVQGSGLYFRNGAPSVDSCLVVGNYFDYGGGTDGGGIYGESSSPVITGCVITGNACNGGWSGGGICFKGASNPVVSGCIISDNDASYTSGGGIAVENGADARLVNCIITGNRSSNGGAGVYVTNARAELNGCLIAGNANQDWSNGGGLYADYSPAVRLTNCTFAANSAYDGGAIAASSSPILLENTVLWGNVAQMSVHEIYDMGGPGITGRYSTVDGGFGGSKCVGNLFNDIAGNTGADPGFVTADSGIWAAGAVYDTVAGVTRVYQPAAGWAPDELAGMCLKPDTAANLMFYITGNTADTLTAVGNLLPHTSFTGAHYRITDYRLPDGSPAADAGTPDTAGLGVNLTDLAGTPRLENGRIDMGAYERANRPPVITSAVVDTATEDVPFTYVPAATDAETYPALTVSGLPLWLTAAGGTLSGMPLEGDGDTSFTLIADDGFGGTDTARVSLTVIAVNDAPVLTSASSDSAWEDLLFVYAGTAYDPDDSVSVISYKNIPSWASVAAGTLSGAPGEGVTMARFTVVATDPAGLVDSLVVNVTVVPVNDRPQVVSNAVDIAAEDFEFSYIAAAYDPDGTPVLSYAYYPAYLAVYGDTLRGTPPEGAGDTSFAVIASDGLLADTQVVSLTVLPINDPPVLTSAPAGTATAYVPYTYTATAVDPDNVPVFIFTGLPGWLAANGAMLSGMPVAGDGDTSFTVYASDGVAADTLVVSLHVIPAVVPPVDTVPPVISMGASCHDGDTLAVSAVRISVMVRDDFQGTTVPARMVRYRLQGSTDSIWTEVPYGDTLFAYDEDYLEPGPYRYSVIAIGAATDTSSVSLGFTVRSKRFPMAGGGWSMLSLPVDAAGTPLSGLLEEGADAYRWENNAASDRYMLKYRPVNGELKSGRACWVRPELSGMVALDSAAYRSTSASVAVEAGWNQLGCPFSYPIRWGAVPFDKGVGPARPVETAGGPVRPYLWTYVDGGYEPATVLMPWQGYFAYSAVAGTLVFDGLEPHLSADPYFWARTAADQVAGVLFSARSIDGLDRYNRIGTAADALDGVDRFDMLEPVAAPGTGLQLSSADPVSGAALAADIRPATGVHDWFLTLRGRPGSTVELTWQPDGTAGDGLTLVDTETGKVYALSSTSGCNVTLASAGVRELLVTSRLPGDDVYGLLQEQRHILVRPQPVGKRADIAVRFPQSEYGQAQSAITVLGVDGNVITRLELGHVVPGIKAVQWEPSLPDGVYVIRVSTPSGWSAQETFIKRNN